MTSNLELGLLELCSIAPGQTAAGALCDMTELASLADGLECELLSRALELKQVPVRASA